MAENDTSNMREEERRGGFTPDAETFHLESLDHHPAREPVPPTADVSAGEDDFTDGVDFEAPMSMEEALRLAEQDDDDDGSDAPPSGIADAPLSSEDDMATRDENLAQSEVNPEPGPEPDPDSAPEQEPDPEPVAEEIEPPVLENENADESDLGAAESESAQAESISLGEELKAILREDLDKSKDRGTAEAPASAIVDSADVQEDIGADHEDAPEIDLSEVEKRDHPSQSADGETDSAGGDDESVGPAPAAVAAASAETGEEDSKKRGLWLPLLAAVLLLCLGSAAAWFWLGPEEDSTELAELSDSLLLETTAPPAEVDNTQVDKDPGGPPETAEPYAEVLVAEGQTADSTDINAGGDTLTAATGGSDDQILRDELQELLPEDGPAASGTQAPIEAADPSAAASASSAGTNKKTSKKSVQSTQQGDGQARESASAPSSNPTPNPVSNPTRSPASTQQARKSQAAPSPRGEYVVQIYSSPSLEDAEEWLRKLQADNVASAFITTQYIRDRIWYRVRFGIFETREAAERSAKDLGYARAWVVRVR